MKTLQITFTIAALLAFVTPSQADTHYNIDKVIDNLIIIESSGNAKALGDWASTPVQVQTPEGTAIKYIMLPKAVGILQIHPIMIKEANRILGRNQFTIADRLDVNKSRRIAKVFLSYQVDRYKKKHGEYPSELRLACSWNSGSIMKQMPSAYLKKYIKFEEM